jgi:hypothetical protein
MKTDSGLSLPTLLAGVVTGSIYYNEEEKDSPLMDY